jgi:YbbR domain-containing protein
MNQPFWQLVQKNLLYLFSLLLSVSLWFYVLSSEPALVSKEVEIKFKLPEGYAIENSVVEKQMIKLQGPRAFVRELENRSLAMIFDLAIDFNAKNLNYELPITSGILPLPLGVNVFAEDNAKLVVTLTKAVTKKIPIQLLWVGEIEKNQQLIGQELNPDALIVRGPPALMERLEVIKTMPVDRAALSGDGQLTLNLEKLDERLIFEKNRTVNFKYSVRPTSANLQINKVKIKFLSEKSFIDPSSTIVSLLVLAKDGNKEISASDVSVIAVVPTGAKGRVRAEVKVELPEGVHLLKVQPEKIFVTIKP